MNTAAVLCALSIPVWLLGYARNLFAGNYPAAICCFVIAVTTVFAVAALLEDRCVERNRLHRRTDQQGIPGRERPEG